MEGRKFYPEPFYISAVISGPGQYPALTGREADLELESSDHTLQLLGEFSQIIHTFINPGCTI